MSNKKFCDICREEISIVESHYIIWMQMDAHGNLDVCKKCWKKITKAVKKMLKEEEDEHRP